MIRVPLVPMMFVWMMMVAAVMMVIMVRPLPAFVLVIPPSTILRGSGTSPVSSSVLLLRRHPTTTTTSSVWKLHMVSIGLGPSSDKDSNVDVAKIAGVDYIVPNHEQHRLDRRSKIDVQCDDWFTHLLLPPPEEEDQPDNHELLPMYGICAGPVAESVATLLRTPPVLMNDIERPNDDVDWTPYVSTRLPWSILYPSYGLEMYGLPIPRRHAEAWRSFDVTGMIAHTIDGSLHGGDQNDVLLRPNHSDDDDDTTDTHLSWDKVRTELQNLGGWLSDDQCTARLIYLNNVFCPELSIQTTSVQNLDSIHGLCDDAVSLLQRITDGWTDTLACPVPMQQNADPLTSYSQLSKPNHNVGPPSSQFAINTQQGTACFAALNTMKCRNIAYIHETTTNTTATSTTEDHHVPTKLPILIVHAVTADGGTTVVDGNDDGIAMHPRTVVIAEPHTDISIVQQSVTLFVPDHDDDVKTATMSAAVIATTSCASRPLLKNGYTQILIKDYANVTHTMVDESGGVALAGMEQADDTVRARENSRVSLRNTVLETLDVHCAGTQASYVGTIISASGNGRTKMASSVSLLKPTARCTLRGLTLTNGLCRTDVRTCIHHIADGCTSNQLQKQMVGGRGTASFRGRIRVEQSAQQTDSHQLSRTVLLSDKCRAYAVPSLEIIADDVKCTHGATVSDLSDEEVFYLRSRGLDVSAARNLLMFAFCNDMVDTIPPSVWFGENGKDGLQKRILQRLQIMTPRGSRAIKGEFQSV